MSRARSGQLAGPTIQPPTPATRATIATQAVAVARTTGPRSPRASRFVPFSRLSTNMKGTTKAGRVYFQVTIIVLNGLPPVIAAAAKGASAVGGETSERTA